MLDMPTENLIPIIEFIIQISMATIGVAYFTGFGVKKLMQFLKSL